MDMIKDITDVLSQFDSRAAFSLGTGVLVGGTHAAIDQIRHKGNLAVFFGMHFGSGLVSYIISKQYGSDSFRLLGDSMLGAFAYHLSYRKTWNLIERFKKTEDKNYI